MPAKPSDPEISLMPVKLSDPEISLTPPKLSDPEIALLWNMASKMVDWINFAWQFYMAVTGVIIGWLFSGSRTLTNPQKGIVTVVFTLIYGLSLVTLINTYKALNLTLHECNAFTKDLVPKTDGFKELLQKNPHWSYWALGLGVHFAWYAIGLSCVWFIVKTATP